MEHIELVEQAITPIKMLQVMYRESIGLNVGVLDPIFELIDGDLHAAYLPIPADLRNVVVDLVGA
jgi:hypothetical protein